MLARLKYLEYIYYLGEDRTPQLRSETYPNDFFVEVEKGLPW